MYKYLQTVEELMEMFSTTHNPKSWEKFYKPKLMKFFCEFLGNSKYFDIPFHKIDNYEITEFLDSFDKKPFLKTNYYNALSSFFKFTYYEKITGDVMNGVEKPILPTIKPDYIEDNHIILIKRYIESNKNKMNNRLLLAFFLYTGLSREYIYNLCNGQLVKNNQGIYYLWIEEIGEQRQLPINYKLCQLIQEYKQLDGTDNPYDKVFDFSEVYFSTKVSKLSREITGKSYSPQTYSNNFIRNALINSSGDIYSVSKLTLKSLNAIEKHMIEPRLLLDNQQKIVDSI